MSTAASATTAADAPDDRETIAQLVRDAGLVPVELGTLAQSRPLDPPSPVWNVVLTPDELTARVDAFRRAAADQIAPSTPKLKGDFR